MPRLGRSKTETFFPVLNASWSPRKEQEFTYNAAKKRRDDK
jgi:hypothetical protein